MGAGEISINKQKMVAVLEYVRIICVIFGFFMAYQPATLHPLRWLVGLVYLPLTGLTALESLFFSTASALSKRREVNSAYQIQSAFNNLAIALVCIMVLCLHLNLQAQATICLVALLFFVLSSLYHGYEYFFKHKPMIHLQRLLLTILLCLASLPLLLPAL